jgi:murein DD-endopeptidase MepM/ murein hydrolase activator NlpD
MAVRKYRDLIILLLITIIVILAAHYYIRYFYTPSVEKVETIYQPKRMYGIVVDSLSVYQDRVKRNQYLADILLKYNVSYATIDHLARSFRSVFDVRKIRAGNKYTILCSNDSVPEIRYFIYEDSPTSFVVFNLSDSLDVYPGQKEINRVVRTTSGIINTSLWNSMVEQNTDPYLAVELSDIYAWTIDFFGIQKGDHYRVIYEELVVEGDTIGVGNVIAACFNHMGNDFYSFYYIQDSVGDYFDEDANSLRKTFLKAPLRYRRISSRFSHSRYHPVLKIRRPHRGVDYAAPSGTPVYSIGDGIVIEKGYERRGGGNYVKVKHNSVYTSVYMHLSGFGKGIKTGKKVKQGDLLGYVGQTGLATGPHLDFRIYKNGQPVDPLKIKSPPAKPVDSANHNAYFNHIKDLEKRLDDI